MSALARFRQHTSLVVRLATLAWLVAHFALTLAYVMPVNPITVGLQPMLGATIGTYFEQNWGMFAPNPRSGDLVLLARPLSDGEFGVLGSEGLPVDGWYDLSTGLWDAFHANRFSAYDRLTRPQTRAVLAYVYGGAELAGWREACDRGEAAACAELDVRGAAMRQHAEMLLTRLASAFAHDAGLASPAVTHLALRARELHPVPWSERYTGFRPTRDVDLGIYPRDDRVPAPGLYRVERPR